MRFFGHGYILLLMFALFAAPASARTVRAVQFGQKDGQESIVITLSDQGGYKLFTISDPDRLVIDIPSADFPGQKDALTHYNGSLIKSIRFGQNSADRSRLVFDLKQRPASISSTLMQEGEGARIEIVLSARSIAAVPPPPPAALKPMIIIDPGHGGQDPGTVGPHGLQEKDITLSIARKLRDALLATGRFRVALTRDADFFILLRDRVQIARKQGGRLFISLHVNSAPDGGVHGAFYLYVVRPGVRRGSGDAGGEGK